MSELRNIFHIFVFEFFINKTFFLKLKKNREGLLVTFEFYVGFKLTTANDTNTKIQQFWEIYSNFGTDYNKFLINLVLSEVRDIVATYEAFDLFQQREAIGNTMFLSISSILFFHYL